MWGQCGLQGTQEQAWTCMNPPPSPNCSFHCKYHSQIDQGSRGLIQVAGMGFSGCGGGGQSKWQDAIWEVIRGLIQAVGGQA